MWMKGLIDMTDYSGDPTSQFKRWKDLMIMSLCLISLGDLEMSQSAWLHVQWWHNGEYMISGVCLIYERVICVVNLTNLKVDFTLSSIWHVKISFKQLSVQFCIIFTDSSNLVSTNQNLVTVSFLKLSNPPPKHSSRRTWTTLLAKIRKLFVNCSSNAQCLKMMLPTGT